MELKSYLETQNSYYNAFCSSRLSVCLQQTHPFNCYLPKHYLYICNLFAKFEIRGRGVVAKSLTVVHMFGYEKSICLCGVLATIN